MTNDHIIRLIEENRLGALTLDELSTVQSHVGHCPDCLKAYRASMVAGSLLKARASETVEPSPFFKTRVMAALKERREVEPSAIVRLWKAAGALVSLMVTVVVVLFALTLFGVSSRQSEGASGQARVNELSLFANNDSVESVLLEDDADIDDQITDGQVLDTVFAEETDGN